MYKADWYSVSNWAAHPWINDDNVAPDRPLGPAVLSRLKQFSAMNKIKKMALRVLALASFSLFFFCIFHFHCIYTT